MADRNTDNAAAAEGSRSDGKGEAPAAAAASGGGFLGWLPLILTVLLMPALAFAMTTYVILPKIERAVGAPAGESAAAHASTATEPGKTAGHGTAKDGKDGKDGKVGKEKQTFSLNKMIVNVAGTMGTRYLISSVTLVGSTPDFKVRAEEKRDQLLDLAASTLCSKTISEIEKPGSRNQIRTELLTVFNTALGDGAVQELYLTEFAIQ